MSRVRYYVNDYADGRLWIECHTFAAMRKLAVGSGAVWRVTGDGDPGRAVEEGMMHEDEEKEAPLKKKRHKKPKTRRKRNRVAPPVSLNPDSDGPGSSGGLSV